MLDDDNEGRRAYSYYNEYFEEAFTVNCYQYKGVNNTNEDFMLENLFDQADIEMINEEFECDDFKRSLALLFYSNADVKEKVIKSLNDHTNRNFNILKE